MRNVDLIYFHVLFDAGLYSEILEHARQRKLKNSNCINEISCKAVQYLDLTDFKKNYLSGKGFDEKGLDINIKRKILIDRDLRDLLFHLQSRYMLRSKGSVLRYILRSYFNRLKCRKTDNEILAGEREFFRIKHR